MFLLEHMLFCSQRLGLPYGCAARSKLLLSAEEMFHLLGQTSPVILTPPPTPHPTPTVKPGEIASANSSLAPSRLPLSTHLLRHRCPRAAFPDGCPPSLIWREKEEESGLRGVGGRSFFTLILLLFLCSSVAGLRKRLKLDRREREMTFRHQTSRFPGLLQMFLGYMLHANRQWQLLTRGG